MAAYRKVEAVCTANIIRSKMLEAYLSLWKGRLDGIEEVSSSGIKTGEWTFEEAELVALGDLVRQILEEDGLSYTFAPRRFSPSEGTMYIPVDRKIAACLGADYGIEVPSLVDITGVEIADPRGDPLSAYRAYRNMIKSNSEKILSHILSYRETYG